jgi:cysteine sulfinate desulfinase/cysteine desulfurase-like protein/adenylyl- and sulfurtransferase ThiI
MYSHVYVRLKTRMHEKPVESIKNREIVESAIQASSPDSPYEIVATHSNAYFAAKLKSPINSAAEVPEALQQALSSSRLVEEFAPSLMVQNPTDPNIYPTIDECMDVFKKWVPQIKIDDYESYGVHCLVARTEKGSGNGAMINFGTSIRDSVTNWMSDNVSQLPSDRSPEMKAKITSLREEAEKLSKSTNSAYIRPTLKTLPLHLDVTRTSAWWYTHSQNGGAVSKTPAEIHTELVKNWKKQTIEQRCGEPVLICKIGEIFLKKGNRAKFLYQLQSNMAFKLQGKAVITRQQYNYVITPPKRLGRHFNDDELEEIRDILKCVPGVDQIQLAYKTLPSEEAMVTTMQYMLGIVSLDNKSCKHTPLNDASMFAPKLDYKDAVYQFLKGATLSEMKRSDEQNDLLSKHTPRDNNKTRLERRMLRLKTHITDIINLGVKIDTSLTHPCFYASKSKLGRQLLDKLLNSTSDLIGDKDRILDPGRYQRFLRNQKKENPDQYLESEDEGVSYDDDTQMGEEQPKEFVGWVKPKSGLFFKVDVYQNEAFIGFHSDIIPGVGGQPIGTGSDTHTVVTLLSGGMDSPVAAYSLMKRGMRVVLVHFQNANLSDEETVQNKIIQLSEHLSKYQISTYLHIVPFAAIQDAIITEVPSPARMLVYRRFMFSIAAKIAKQYEAKFLVVGDAVGQVASQTPANLFASYSNAPMPLLSPLVGSNKQEIMDTAKDIGTYPISALPYGDCCSYFLAKHPLTSIKKELLYEYEANVGRTIIGGNEKLIVDAQNASAIYRWFKPQDGMISLRAMKAVKSHHDDIANRMLMECPANPIKKADRTKGEFDETIDFIGRDDNLTQTDIEKMMDPAELAKMKALNKKRKIVDYEKEMGDENAVELDLDEESSILSEQQINDKDHTKKQKQSTKSDSEGLNEVELDSYNKNSSIIAYLDSASTTRILPSVATAVQRFTSGQLFGNSSSLHVVGKTSDLAVKQASDTLLALINAHPQSEEQSMNVYGIGGDDRMIYTSGGTESNNLALIGSLRHLVQKQVNNIVSELGFTPHGEKLPPTQLSHPNNLSSHSTQKYILGVHLITSSLEHHAILEPLQSLLTTSDSLIANRYGLDISVNVVLDYVQNDNNGVCSSDSLTHILTARPHVNNILKMKQNLGIDMNDSNVRVIDAATIVSIMHSNNEIGTIQPLVSLGSSIQKHKQSLAKLLKNTTTRETSTDILNKVLFHSDACQSFGKLHLDVQQCNLDLMTLNGHKLHGVKGIGALYLRPGVKVTPLQLGGKHQHNIRSGTLNVPGIISLQYAALYCYSIPQNLTTFDQIKSFLHKQYKSSNSDDNLHDSLTQHGKELKQKQFNFIFKLKQLFPNAQVNGPNSIYFPNSHVKDNTNALSFDDINNLEHDIYTNPTKIINSLPSVVSILFDPSSQLDSPGIVKYLSTRGVCVSAGSACASNNSEPKPSHVLKGIGLKDEWSNGTVRISLGLLTSQTELNNAYEVFQSLSKDLHTIYSKKGNATVSVEKQ